MGESVGSVIRIDKKNDKWIASTYVKLPAAPFAVNLDSKNNLIIFTAKGFIKVSHREAVILTPKWANHIYYPNNMATLNSISYIATTKGVYSYNIITKEQSWLLPN
jgi:hypothetical protein